MIELSTAQVAQYLGVTKRTIQRHAIKGDWHFEQKKNVGGIRKIYTYNQLPFKTKQKIAAAIIPLCQDSCRLKFNFNM